MNNVSRTIPNFSSARQRGIALTSLFFLLNIMVFNSVCFCQIIDKEPISYVKGFTGTGGYGGILPAASAPFGMVQLGPDTRFTGGTTYLYSDSLVYGFSHLHKSGGGCTTFTDIAFLPITDFLTTDNLQYPDNVSARFSHDHESFEPGYYKVKLLNTNIDVELTATERCGMHRYIYPKGKAQQLILDLKIGYEHGCTIYPEDDFDTVKVAHIEIVNQYAVKGYRITNGFTPELYSYFYAEFSKPIKSYQLYADKKLKSGADELTGRDLRLVMEFGEDDSKTLLSRVGISPSSMENAAKNLHAEINTWDFDIIKKQTQISWNKTLSAIQISDNNSPQKEMFYTSLYLSAIYPMLYSDVTGEYRSSDMKVHKGDFRYYAGVLGLWDTFRAQLPLLTILRPDITNDLMKTFLEHYNNSGQLPQWVSGGQENHGMIGYHAMPVIADAYFKGIRNYNVNALYDAMKISANVDTFGFFCRAYRGATFYIKYGYVPCDIEIQSVSKTLEYCYDDWCIAQMAKMLGKREDYAYYIKRAGYFKNLFDPETRLMRPKLANGQWKAPFDPLFTNHYHPGDDYTEGTAYQWTFFVPHDGNGLINLFGGKENFISQLDSLFIRKSDIHDGGKGSPDLTGMVGQYCQGNEPDHHAIYIYNYAGEPWKTQQWINYMLKNMYHPTPDGLCGNDDTGQMSAWYVFSAMGFYPVTHGQGIYCIGAPLFKDLRLKHNKGTLIVKANHVSKENIYVRSVSLNGKPYTKNWLQHNDIFSGNAELVFEMGNTPNIKWGSSKDDLPPSMSEE
jgi:predicted alpha-1,2-mannosidase